MAEVNIYIVAHGEKDYFVEAANATQARNYIAKKLLKVEKARPRDMIGVDETSIEQASAPDAAPVTP